MSLNITIVVAPTLRNVVDGRGEISLGVPSDADVGDVFITLLQLYPKLKNVLAADSKSQSRTIQLLLSERGARELARRGSGLHEGEKLLLIVASVAAREEVGVLKG